jgi:hypothetical protein
MIESLCATIIMYDVVKRKKLKKNLILVNIEINVLKPTYIPGRGGPILSEKVKIVVPYCISYFLPTDQDYQ